MKLHRRACPASHICALPGRVTCQPVRVYPVEAPVGFNPAFSDGLPAPKAFASAYSVTCTNANVPT